MKPKEEYIDVVLRPVRYGQGDKWVSVPVRLEDGSEGFVYVGGQVDSYFHNGIIKVFVKRNKASVDTPSIDVV